ncbi:hypothetical protein llap_6129 [Limosa lapponica baueri]|uniref:Uncharacterized protein n=1 Tax=Limosa lapponica baueri TaxID=1758121 RepID=A0A2I0UBX7_LIMLA|nr:hypothetical protein llap_6129 [Limosa lapponica baueri]
MGAGETDEEAFAEECRRRGQHALPFQPTNPRLLKPHKPASSPKYAFHYNSDEVEEQDRSRVTSSLETPFYLSGVHKHVDEKCAEKDPSASQKPKPKSQAKALDSGAVEPTFGALPEALISLLVMYTWLFQHKGALDWGPDLRFSGSLNRLRLAQSSLSIPLWGISGLDPQVQYSLNADNSELLDALGDKHL